MTREYLSLYIYTLRSEYTGTTNRAVISRSWLVRLCRCSPAVCFVRLSLRPFLSLRPSLSVRFSLSVRLSPPVSLRPSLFVCLSLPVSCHCAAGRSVQGVIWRCQTSSWGGHKIVHQRCVQRSEGCCGGLSLACRVQYPELQSCGISMEQL